MKDESLHKIIDTLIDTNKLQTERMDELSKRIDIAQKRIDNLIERMGKLKQS